MLERDTVELIQAARSSTMSWTVYGVQKSLDRGSRLRRDEFISVIYSKFRLGPSSKF